VATIDRQARRLAGTIPVGRNPVQLAVTPDGRWLYVANQGSKARDVLVKTESDLQQMLDTLT
ncbi:MAG TPA: hypothetical protein PLY26_06375, partial [Ferruginibacter sp.]|nr:hypothetical protein [Ferruginibacter sp.]